MSHSTRANSSGRRTRTSATVNMTTAKPDGCLYIVDMYRGIIP